MMKPAIIAASSGSSTVSIPINCAITPPRSMSPTRTTGTSAPRAKPMLAMSFRRRLTSAGLPAPSTSTRSQFSFSRSKLSSTAGKSCGLSSAYSRARKVATRLPCTTTCAPMSLSGFRSTGFMSVCCSTPAAIACSAWARPISPPSTVTAALFDTFCGLKGSTRIPRRFAARASPATMSDLPTSEPAPWIIRARGRLSGLELDTGLGLDAGPERMLQQSHFGNEVRDVDQLLLGIAAGQHDMRERGLGRLQERDDLVDIEIVVTQRDVDLVEHDHAQARIGYQLFCFLPSSLRRGDIAGLVLGFPGKTFAHRMKLTELAEMTGQKPALAGIPCTLDELHHCE